MSTQPRAIHSEAALHTITFTLKQRFAPDIYRYIYAYTCSVAILAQTILGLALQGRSLGPQKMWMCGVASPLLASSCADETISEIIMGMYMPRTHGNHGKVVYKKADTVDGEDVFIYFWDERDGPEYCGWWIGPSVGGDLVWAYHPSRAATPPSSDWSVPHDGMIDPNFSVRERALSVIVV